jgi:signal transduction histidine kinase
VKLLNELVTIQVTQPESVRQRKLLNILVVLLATTGIVQGILLVVLQVLHSPLHPPLAQERFRLLTNIGSPAIVVACVLVFVINRYWSARLAQGLFVLVLAIAVYINTSDDWFLATLTYALSIPIVIGSFLIGPRSGFALALLSSVVTTLAGLITGAGVYVTPFFTFMAISMLAWFMARTLKLALADLRALNVELDQRVRDRTEDLTEALARNQAILDSTVDGVIVFDNTGLAIITNPAISDLMELPVEEIMGQHVDDLLRTGEEAKDDRRGVSKLVNTGGASEAALKFQWGERTLSITVAPVNAGSAEQNLGTVTVFRDYTREAEVDRMKSSFISIASHELRTPLNAILGYADILHEQIYGPLSGQQRDVTRRILSNANHMLSLVSNLLDRAQIEAGTLELNIASFSPAKVVGEAVGAMDVLAQQKDLDLSCEVDSGVPAEAVGDWQRVSQIVIILVANALKFTHEGSVRVRTYCPDAAHWAIEVADTGIGIPKEAHSYIFEPFRRADESATREQGGAGLGLSIAKQLVTIMGGSMVLESEVGKGTTFAITLPLEMSANGLPVCEDREVIGL